MLLRMQKLPERQVQSTRIQQNVLFMSLNACVSVGFCHQHFLPQGAISQILLILRLRVVVFITTPGERLHSVTTNRFRRRAWRGFEAIHNTKFARYLLASEQNYSLRASFHFKIIGILLIFFHDFLSQQYINVFVRPLPGFVYFKYLIQDFINTIYQICFFVPQRGLGLFFIVTFYIGKC